MTNLIDSNYLIIDYKDEYTKLSKSALVQDCRMFNDAKIKAKKCVDLLNKCIYLLNQVKFERNTW